MKKSFICATALAVLSLMVGCSEKEGMFSPEKKIGQVFQSNEVVMESFNGTAWDTVGNEVTPKTLKESWTWDGNKLKKIDLFYDNGGKKSSLEFTYEKRRLSRVEEEDVFSTFTYDGKNLAKAEIYYKEINPLVPYVVYTFTYSGDKLSKIEMVSRGDMKSSAPVAHSNLEKMIFRLLLSESKPILKALSQSLGNDGRKDGNRQVAELEWNGNNVSKITTKDDEGVVTVTYTYDNKRNPYQHFVATICGVGDGEGMAFANENNITKAVYTLEEGVADETEFVENYSYIYSGDWPESCTSCVVYDDGSDSRWTERSTQYYEYK